MTIKNRQLEDAPRKYSGSSAPAVGASEGAFYAKLVSGNIEGFYIDSAGREIQLTNLGKVRHDPLVVGEANTASNAGSIGEGLAKTKNGVDLPFKRIKAGSNITLNPTTDYIEIIANFPPAVGEANTCSNVGLSGINVFKQKSGVNFEFRKIKAGNNVVITQTSNDEIQIDAVGGGGGGGEANTASNLGTGTALFAQKSGVNLQFKSLKVSGAGLSISSSATEVTITASGSGSGDMLKSVYDTNDDGVVNNSAQLNGQAASFYLSRANHTGTQAAATITGLAAVATSGSYNDLSNKPTIPTNLDSLTDVAAPSPSNGQVLQWNGSAWVNATVSGGGQETQILSFDSGNIVIRASGSTADLALVTATKDFSTTGVSKVILNRPTSVIYHSVYATFSSTETSGRTAVELHCPDMNGATSEATAIRPLAVRFNSTYGIGATTSTFSLVSGTTFKTAVSGYTQATEQKSSFIF